MEIKKWCFLSFFFVKRRNNMHLLYAAALSFAVIPAKQLAERIENIICIYVLLENNPETFIKWGGDGVGRVFVFCILRWP